ncbi:MAG: hypothetical protein WC481_01795 [Candidatus Omnitrophota bacterium]
MKKLVALAVVICFAATCHAAWWDKDSKKEGSTTTITTGKDAAKKPEQAPVNVMKGLIISVNIPQNEIVVKDEKTLIDRVLIVKPEMYKAIKVGDAVEVKTKTGSSIVDNIKVTKAASVEKKIGKKTK